jgi:riboflavin biosynthesis pyrimidine reductase
MTHPLRRLLPDAAETTLDDELDALDLIGRAHENRPYLVTNFALTLDGHATLEGRSGPIGSEVDTALLVGLRLRTDALMIGAGTMRTERYGRIFSKPERRAQREAAGLRPDPLMVLVSGSLDLPWDAELFTAGGGHVLVATSSGKDPPETATELEVRRYEGAVDLRDLVTHLRRDHGVRALLSEGGPRLHGQLVELGLVDELFITYAPKISGGVGPGLVAELAERERAVEPAGLLFAPQTGELFGRYRRAGGA